MAIPAEVTTALETMATDALTVCALVFAAVVAVYAFRFIRLAMFASSVAGAVYTARDFAEGLSMRGGVSNEAGYKPAFRNYSDHS